MNNFNEFMTPRLCEIASMVPFGASIIDVGCDHGYIPIYLAGKGVIKKAIASDVNEGPLLSAKNNIEKFGFSDIVKTAKSNGLCDINCEDYDTVIIAGMGGVLISEILSFGVRGKTYILQPMTTVEYLMEYLSDNGFCVENHVLVEEDNHIYNILKVVDGIEKLDGIDLYLGNKIQKNELYFKYAKRLRTKFKKIIQGLSNSKTDKKDEIDKYKILLDSVERKLQ